MTIKPGVAAVSIALVMLYLIRVPECWVGKVLNTRLVRHVGTISYSLYLWQQIFMSETLHLLPAGFLLAFGAAELSFWAVERPSLKLRSWLESRKRLAA